MQAAGVPVGAGSARSWAEHAAVGGIVLALMAVGAVAAAIGLGYRPLLVRSGSMAPAIDTGDVVLSKVVVPGEVTVGDIVTFRDPSRDQLLVTHRVVSKETQAHGVAFVTRGDANSGIESWSVASDGRVGRVSMRIPKVGYLLAWLGHPVVRLGALLLGCLLVGWAMVRRIWSG